MPGRKIKQLLKNETKRLLPGNGGLTLLQDSNVARLDRWSPLDVIHKVSSSFRMLLQLPLIKAKGDHIALCVEKLLAGAVVLFPNDLEKGVDLPELKSENLPPTKITCLSIVSGSYGKYSLFLLFLFWGHGLSQHPKPEQDQQLHRHSHIPTHLRHHPTPVWERWLELRMPLAPSRHLSTDCHASCPA